MLILIIELIPEDLGSMKMIVTQTPPPILRFSVDLKSSADGFAYAT